MGKKALSSTDELKTLFGALSMIVGFLAFSHTIREQFVTRCWYCQEAEVCSLVAMRLETLAEVQGENQSLLDPKNKLELVLESKLHKTTELSDKVTIVDEKVAEVQEDCKGTRLHLRQFEEDIANSEDGWCKLHCAALEGKAGF